MYIIGWQLQTQMEKHFNFVIDFFVLTEGDVVLKIESSALTIVFLRNVRVVFHIYYIITPITLLVIKIIS